MVTGAYGYSGQYIAKRLLDEGCEVRTLTNSPNRPNPFGDSEYKLQPVYVDDLAALAVREGKSTGNKTIDAIGPETFTYRELVQAIGQIIGVKRPIVSIPPWLGYIAGWFMGLILRDKVITKPEIEGLMRGLLHTDSPPTGETRLTE